MMSLYCPKERAQGVGGFASVGEAEIAHYRAQGYLVLHDAFTPDEVAEAKAGLWHLLKGGVPEFTHREIEAAAQEVFSTLSPEEQLDALRKIMDFTRFEPRLKAIAEKPALMTLITRLIGETPVRFQDMALLKPPHWGREKPWHQDHAYFDLPLGTPIVGVWIALDRATIENGCMFVWPGGHHTGPHLHFQQRDWQICDTEMEGRESVAVPLEPGGCLLFDGLLPHGTPPNRSPHRRHALQFHYKPASATSIDAAERLRHFGGTEQGMEC